MMMAMAFASWTRERARILVANKCSFLEIGLCTFPMFAIKTGRVPVLELGMPPRVIKVLERQ